MSLSKPVAKQARTMKTPALQRTESVLEIPMPAMEEERNRRIPATRREATDSLSTTMTTMTKENQTPKHPRGHKVRALSEVWSTMDSQDFLHLSDTFVLSDVWVYPTGVVSSKGEYATVSFKQIVAAPHIKFRDTTSKMSLDDLIKMLYLNDCIQADLQNVERISFDDWLKEKSSVCVKMKGMDEGSDRAKLCHFIITEDRDFTFYPAFLNNASGIFFRKICYHSYPTDDDDKGKIKIENPSMIKCKGAKGKFEYIIEARVFPLPMLWFDTAKTIADKQHDDTLEVPESQVY